MNPKPLILPPNRELQELEAIAEEQPRPADRELTHHALVPPISHPEPWIVTLDRKPQIKNARPITLTPDPYTLSPIHFTP